jgi:hypothetical protein
VNPGIATTVLLGAETNLEGANARSTGSSDSLTATIDWGDETAADNLQLPSLNGPIDASHVYSSSGQFSGVILVNNQFGDRGRVVFTAEVRVAADIAPVPPDVKFDEILLHNGTSIVSVPWRLQDPNVNAVFTSPSVVSVSSIDAAIGTFASAVRDAGTGDLAGDLTEIEPGLGYLVVTTAAATIPLLIDTGAPATPITLYPGWNLIGYAPSVLKPWMTVDDYLADLNNEWQALYTWDQEAGVWLAAAPPGATLVPGFGGFAFGLPAPQFQDVTDNPLHFVSAGQGYWIYSSETRVLTP